jgi:hypothetical protein
MTFVVASVVFNDSSSKFNKDLTDFFRRNLETAVRKGRMTFNFRIANTNELPDLRKKGIKRLPAMIIGRQDPFIGVPDIIAEIRRIVQTSKADAPTKTEDEIVRDYQLSALGDVKKDEKGHFVINDADDDNPKSDDLQAKAMAEMRRRGLDQSSGEEREARMVGGVDRGTTRDTDTEDRRPARNAPMYGERPRQDNLASTTTIDNPNMADAFQSLKRIGRNATAEDKQDDDLVSIMLQKLSD